MSGKVSTKFNNFLIKGTNSDNLEVQDLSWKIVNIGWETICNTRDREKFWFFKILGILNNKIPIIKRKDTFIYNMRNYQKPLSFYMLYKECTEPLLMFYLKHAHPHSLSIPEKSYNTLVKENLKIMIDKASENDLSGASVISFVNSDTVTPIEKRNKLGYLLNDS